VTGSLVVIALYRIRKAYVSVYLSEHTEPAVKNLTAILLKDFDTRFKPADPSGKITYTGSPDVGARNRYTVVHPYLVVASLLDPRVKGHLGGTSDNAEYIMLPDHFEALRLDVVDHMIAYCLEHSIHGDNCNADPVDSGDIEEKGKVGTITLDEEELMFGGMDRMNVPQKLEPDRSRCN